MKTLHIEVNIVQLNAIQSDDIPKIGECNLDIIKFSVYFIMRVLLKRSNHALCTRVRTRTKHNIFWLQVRMYHSIIVSVSTSVSKCITTNE